MFSEDSRILRLALPSIVQNITVPLLGLADLAIVGHMGSARYIAAVSVGTMVFNVMYWLLGFLRMGTSGMTSQALGRRDFPAVMGILRQTLLLGSLLALGLVVMQVPIRWIALHTMLPSSELAGCHLPTAAAQPSLVGLVTTYFNICVWGAPAVLCLYGLTGWFIGMQNTRLPMLVAVGQNLMNIAASLSLVFGLGMKMEGVALGTLVAQWSGLLLALFLWWRHYGRRSALRHSVKKMSYRHFFAVNRDIFLRTVCLVAVNLFFTAAGSRQGVLMLSVNTLLMTLFMLFSYVMDGFAFAGEALCGRYYGARNRVAFQKVVRRLFVWGGVMVVLFTLVYAFGGEAFLGLLTDEQSVVLAARPYFWWAVLVPVIGVAAFIYDGVFIGITATRGMLFSCSVATAAFFLLHFLLFTLVGNHSLWIALLTYMALRGGLQAWWLRRLLRR
ncbi:MAG: MATE family efflux transporter [Prevotella sp.]|nr:MATE family efflux transporter [Prevotella sp.]